MYEQVIDQWYAVQRIPLPHIIADEKELLLECIEEPLREAVSILFDKHVPTTNSSCNIRDYAEGNARITVFYDYLSSGNRKVVDRYDFTRKSSIRHERIGRLITLAGLFIPIEVDEVPSDISKKAVALAGMFQEQPHLLPPNV